MVVIYRGNVANEAHIVSVTTGNGASALNEDLFRECQLDLIELFLCAHPDIVNSDRKLV